MKCLLFFFLGVVACILVNSHFENKTSFEKNQKIERLEKELYETKLEVRKFWKEKNQAWREVVRLKGRLNEIQN